MKMKLAEAHPSSEWTMCDLERALENLKNNKSRDSEGLINEIFKKDVIGKDLKKIPPSYVQQDESKEIDCYFS